MSYPSQPVEVLYSYAPEDELLSEKLGETPIQTSSMRRISLIQQRLTGIKVPLSLSIGLLLGFVIMVLQQFWWPTVWLWLVTHW